MTKKYYVSLSSGEINQSNTASDWNYAIEATDEDVEFSRMDFFQMIKILDYDMHP